MNWNRLLSLGVAVCYLVIAWVVGGSYVVARLVLFLICPIACIWFGDGLGRLTGVRFGLIRPYVTDETPARVVSLVGWLLLFLPVCLWILPWVLGMSR